MHTGEVGDKKHCKRKKDGTKHWKGIEKTTRK
jgi:hypothetical protein